MKSHQMRVIRLEGQKSTSPLLLSIFFYITQSSPLKAFLMTILAISAIPHAREIVSAQTQQYQLLCHLCRLLVPFGSSMERSVRSPHIKPQNLLQHIDA
jgi:hypothetical protein